MVMKDRHIILVKKFSICINIHNCGISFNILILAYIVKCLNKGKHTIFSNNCNLFIRNTLKTMT